MTRRESDQRLAQARASATEARERIASVLGVSLEQQTLGELVEAIDRLLARRLPMHAEAELLLSTMRESLAILAGRR
jgi:hypothetical protein